MHRKTPAQKRKAVHRLNNDHRQNTAHRQTAVRLSLVIAVLLMFRSQAGAQSPTVDFSYSPARYFAAICFPNDWLKTVVTENNGLGYDFGPGPYAQPLTEITVRAAGEVLSLTGHRLEEPGIPIVTALLKSPGLTVRQEVFAVPLGKSGASSARKSRTVDRLLGWNGTIGWARPEGTVDSAFRSTAWGVNRPILYRVRVSPGSEKTVALGICEPYKWAPGTRVLELRVEGAEPAVFDPMANGKKNEPHVLVFKGRDENRDGRLVIEAHAAPSSPDPNPILNAFWIFPPEARVTPGELIAGKATGAELSFDCGTEEELWQNELRADLLLSTFEGRSVVPEIIVRSTRTLEYDSRGGILMWHGRPFLLSRPRPVSASFREDAWHLLLPTGTARAETFVLHGPWTAATLKKLPESSKAKENSNRFWRMEARLPQTPISVPDSGIQYLLDASVRNLYQIAELVDGGQEYHPGPSVYRGLWVHDATWHISALLFLGDVTSARVALENLLHFQLPSGQVKVMAPYVMNRETPIVAYTMFRFAHLSGDREWLASHWDNFHRALTWTAERRRETLGDPGSPGYGLFPPGFADGGLGGVGFEYASAYWALIAFRAGVDASLWMGKRSEAERWQSQYDELMTSFRRAARRDMRRNDAGHWYLPPRVEDTSRTAPPQQASWAIFDAQGIAHLFDTHDSLVTGTLAMLEDSTKEGLPTNTGWLKDGLWPFFGSLQGITQTYQRDYAAAQRLLYAVANHASPIGTWVEEQLPRPVGQKTSGDGSNATASALFIKQVRRLLIMERGDTLELVGGVPSSWYRPGARIAANNVPTEFGRVTFSITVTADGRRATARISPAGKAGEPGCSSLELRGLREAGFISSGGSPMPVRLTVARGKGLTINFEKP